MLDLGGIDLLRCYCTVLEQILRLATPNTFTDMLLRTRTVRNTAAAHITYKIHSYITYMKLPYSRSIQVELGKVESF